MVTTTAVTANMMQAASVSPSPTSSSPVNGGASDTGTTIRRVSENRRSNKPIMEKRRRARINNCLNELKTLILDAMKKDPARHSKLEKADILEMTVKHLQNLQRQQLAMSAASDPSVVNKFKAGFNECATEVGRFPGLDPIVKRRLLQHLANCLNQSHKPQEVPQVQVHILPNTQKSPEQQVPQSSGIILSNGSGTGVQLVPTRLPNGDIALVLPTSITQQQHSVGMVSPIPLLVPIVPERSPSTMSATSSSSQYSPSHSPEPMDMYCEAKPLSLVVRKEDPMDDKPWRPW
ncbi:unnamed protein product [Callosobruchus maculatus]|uniref:BHLH domain-containing protein n=1 Tax=Callosobruchus maculatus TaxID=64391 RepID=A0A653DCD0_CALMS|nr:unnamed protein product [Callosobruchus maculatus]